jgi:hypothetical protein
VEQKRVGGGEKKKRDKEENLSSVDPVEVGVGNDVKVVGESHTQASIIAILWGRRERERERERVRDGERREERERGEKRERREERERWEKRGREERRER